jgi:hypothetical protein
MFSDLTRPVAMIAPVSGITPQRYAKRLALTNEREWIVLIEDDLSTPIYYAPDTDPDPQKDWAFNAISECWSVRRPSDAEKFVTLTDGRPVHVLLIAEE